jgi:hypothetical protein
MQASQPYLLIFRVAQVCRLMLRYSRTLATFVHSDIIARLALSMNGIKTSQSTCGREDRALVRTGLSPTYLALFTVPSALLDFTVLILLKSTPIQSPVRKVSFVEQVARATQNVQRARMVHVKG